tara:strand:- start:1350 stop:1628 length:279 start_codon:yes stop_codon:yes gene_type:complete
MDTISQWYRKVLSMLEEKPELCNQQYSSESWIEFCKQYAKWDNRSQIDILESKIESLEKELEYYKTPYHKRLLNKIKPLLNIRFKVVMYSKD